MSVLITDVRSVKVRCEPGCPADAVGGPVGGDSVDGDLAVRASRDASTTSPRGQVAKNAPARSASITPQLLEPPARQRTRSA